eukprot:scaffold74475_cov32-Tisochrysis_lutea.AAC.6
MEFSAPPTGNGQWPGEGRWERAATGWICESLRFKCAPALRSEREWRMRAAAYPQASSARAPARRSLSTNDGGGDSQPSRCPQALLLADRSTNF